MAASLVSSLASPLAKTLIPKFSSYMESQYIWGRDMKDDLTKLKDTQRYIKIVVAAAERGQNWNQNLKDEVNELLREFKDAIYEADDVLDEFEYQDMEARAKEARDPVSCARDTVSCITSFFLRFAKRLIGQDELGNQLRKVLKKLENINTKAKKLINVLHLDRTIPSEEVAVNPNRETSSIISEDKIFGRDKEKNDIVNLLLQQSADEPESSDSKPFQIISIVGIGGVGKTTLAQLVYNHSKGHFELHMWVCVSDRFDRYRFTREMLVSVSGNSGEQQDSKDLSLNVLQTKLQTKLKSKRFLLVLDDVWMDEKMTGFENKETWEKLLAPLKDGAKGSKILVTTRSKNVADMFNKKNSIFLEGLEEDDYWKLFERCAFGDKNADDYSELKDIANKIVKRLKGSPLAAKAIGNLLQGNLDCGKWNKILQAGVFDDINKILKLSYEHLPDHLKYCFAYCSIFPKDWEFDRQKLAFLWAAQGYVQSGERDNSTEEEIGIDYFDELVSRSFFQIVEKDYSKSYYVMHDLMHDLAEHVSYDECFRIDGGKQRSIGPSIRHIGVDLEHGMNKIEDVWSVLENMNNWKNLRTLIFLNPNSQDSIDLPSWFKEVRRLRVLGCERFGKFGGDIGHLVHLRYLDLGHGLMQHRSTGPESLSVLFHLKAVFLGSQMPIHCKSLTELSTFGKLTHIFGEPLRFVLEEERGVRDLKDMKLLRLRWGGRVSIENVENVGSEVEAAEVGLEHHHFIHGLWLMWGDSDERRIVRHDSEEKVVDALKPHPNLQKLIIFNFGGRRCPSWLETNWLINLQYLSLSGCKGLEVMPPLGHLPCLKNLNLKIMGSMERIGMEFYGDGNVKGFPSLEKLWFEDMPAWVEWSAPEFPVFPRLRRLEVLNCPNLKQFLSFPRAVEEPMTPLLAENCLELKQFPSFPSLSSLRISDCGITDVGLSRWLQGLSSISSLYIGNCNGLTSLPSAEVLHRLTALQQMSIYKCRELASLGSLHALPSLRNLSVIGCAKLKSLPEEGLPPLIKDIKLEGCHLALKEQIWKKEGPEWDKIARIPSLQVLRSNIYDKYLSSLSRFRRGAAPPDCTATNVYI